MFNCFGSPTKSKSVTNVSDSSLEEKPITKSPKNEDLTKLPDVIQEPADQDLPSYTQSEKHKINKAKPTTIAGVIAKANSDNPESSSSTRKTKRITKGQDANGTDDGQNKIRVIMIVDKSGSMQSNRKATINNFNEWLQSQKISATEEETELPSFTIVQFSEKNSLVEYDCISKTEELTKSTYKPEGCTALYDAIGLVLDKYKNDLDNIVCIITDGEDNMSKTYNQKTIAAKIDKYQTEKDWSFTYLGAHDRAQHTGASMNINTTIQFENDSQGYNNMYTTQAITNQIDRGYQNYKRTKRSGGKNAEILPDYNSYADYRLAQEQVVTSRIGAPQVIAAPVSNQTG